MSIEDKLKELAERKAKVTTPNPQFVEKQHSKGKLTARERINLLLDPDSFEEFDALAKTRSTYFDLDKKFIPADGVITGIGTIN
jgi:propionyl-CoA carboxylase beta chain